MDGFIVDTKADILPYVVLSLWYVFVVLFPYMLWNKCHQ